MEHINQTPQLNFAMVTIPTLYPILSKNREDPWDWQLPTSSMEQHSSISEVNISPHSHYIDRISIRNAERLNDKDFVNHYRAQLSAQSEKLNA